MPTVERIQQLIQAYADGPRRLEAAVAGVSEEELNFKPAPEHWSIRENVIHLVDADLVAATRLRYVLAQPGATLVSFDQNAWATALRYSSQALAPAVALFRAARESTADLLRRAPLEAWGYAGVNTQSGLQTVEWIVEHFDQHLDGHLKTIAKRRQQRNESVGGRR
jgi:hypothetical protein